MDDDLGARLRKGDETALAELYDAVSRRAFGLAFRITRDEADAADVVQEAFAWIWEQSHRIDGSKGRPEALLLTVVHHRAIDSLRRRQRQGLRSRPLADADGMLPEDGSPLRGDELYAAIRRSFPALPEEQRDVIERVYFDGLTQLEVATQFGIPLGTVKSRLRLGLEKLRTMISTGTP